MDAMPEMTARKTKIDMHVTIATKILSEIKRRELNNISDWGDAIMSGKLTNQERVDLIRFLGRETASATPEEFNDKFRLLVIIALCTSDRTLVIESIAAVKEVHPDLLTEQLETFLQKLIS